MNFVLTRKRLVLIGPSLDDRLFLRRHFSGRGLFRGQPVSFSFQTPLLFFGSHSPRSFPLTLPGFFFSTGTCIYLCLDPYPLFRPALFIKRFLFRLCFRPFTRLFSGQ